MTKSSYTLRKEKTMEEFMEQIKTIMRKQSKLAIELKTPKANFIWTGTLFNIEYQLGTLYVMGDGLELELNITSENIRKCGENPCIEDNDLEVFFNIEEM